MTRLEGRHRIALGGFLALATLVFTILAAVVHSSMAAGRLTNEVTTIKETVCKDYGPRIRSLERSATKRDTQYDEIMRMLKEIKDELKEERKERRDG